MKHLKIIVGLSGGVDSSVAAMLLKQQGYNVEALFMKNWNHQAADGTCLWEADVEDAMQVCDKLAIPLNTVDLSADYRDKVFNNLISEYKNGRTPNPDVLCNREIKFKAFLQHAERLGADKIATGHYAQTGARDNTYRLLKGRDDNKDQSYFLCRLNQAQLRKSWFPVGGLKKAEVRSRARHAGLITHNKKDSTGLCFIGEQPFGRFLRRYLPPEPGLIKTPAGEIIGEHDGSFYYTPGQRQGLGIGGVKGAAAAPWYVVQKNTDANELIVAQQHDHPLLHNHGLTASDVHWIAGETPAAPFRCQAKNRYRQADQACTVEPITEDRWQVSFERSQRALTPGQVIVFYQGKVCLGGGTIDSVF